MSRDLVNDSIPNAQFLIIDDKGNKLGIFDRTAALKIADQHDLDILVVSGHDAKPLVAKLVDYSKMRYDQQKKERENKKNQKITVIKEIRLSPTIDKHDFDTKLKHALRFVADGDKVKISMRLRGRMIVHKDLGLQVANKFIEGLGTVFIEVKPKLEGNTIIAVVTAPKTK